LSPLLSAGVLSVCQSSTTDVPAELRRAAGGPTMPSIMKIDFPCALWPLTMRRTSNAISLSSLACGLVERGAECLTMPGASSKLRALRTAKSRISLGFRKENREA
jgi:hypothetical protein